MGRTISEAQKNAYKKYITGTDELRTRVPKGTRQIVNEHIGKTGETMQEFILRAIAYTMTEDERNQYKRLAAYKVAIDAAKEAAEKDTEDSR